MRVFVTGATGFVGSTVVNQLLSAGHKVLGLARSEASAQKLIEAGAEVHLGSLTDIESLKSGALQTDGIIHTGFIHDFSRFAESCEIDRNAILTMGEAIAGTGKPFIITSGLALLSTGRLLTEQDEVTPENSKSPRKASEEAAKSVAQMGVNVSVMRLPPSVHDAGDHGFVPILINLAREKGEAAYLGDGQNKWPAVHRLDAAVLYQLALEKNAPWAVYHAVGEQGIPFADIASTIGENLNLPIVSKTTEEAAEYFGWFNYFGTINTPASGEQTKQILGWQPTHIGLIEDMNSGAYFAQ
ncbi:SDR family oxidoreductase [Mucilaginibacter roseus]|uniref:SDR family oxidoreductase n=1 Tax=Mucilaginibacter roseus TaxID=1528868 RepID=A0ABS8U162_9SPHI|nr:SDR family oxidoreductase [Mucilaginibacter roseus]MCD8739253.1 SDR family oxidoreductase [Mucilaginibacter roseus]